MRQILKKETGPAHIHCLPKTSFLYPLVQNQYKVYMKTLTANIRLSFKQILHHEIWADNIKLIIFPGEKKMRSPQNLHASDKFRIGLCLVSYSSIYFF